MIRHTTAVATLILLAFASPADAQQSAPGTLAFVEARSRADVDEADALAVRARAMQSDPRRFPQAARLYIAAAQLRGPGDERTLQSLIIAARLRGHAGDLAGAHEALMLAADAATARGDVLAAAHLNVDGALVAQRIGDAALMLENVERAELLLHSPLLTAEQRLSVARRILR